MVNAFGVTPRGVCDGFRLVFYILDTKSIYIFKEHASTYNAAISHSNLGTADN